MPSDAAVVCAILEAAFENKIRQQNQLGQTGVASFWMALKVKQLANFLEAKRPGSAGASQAEPTFHGDIGLQGFTPLMAATRRASAASR